MVSQSAGLAGIDFAPNSTVACTGSVVFRDRSNCHGDWKLLSDERMEFYRKRGTGSGVCHYKTAPDGFVLRCDAGGKKTTMIFERPRAALALARREASAHCGVGLVDTDTEFQAHGVGANVFCRSLTTTSQVAYRRSGAPTAPLACRYQMRSGTAVSVYADAGDMPTLGGEDACARLREESTDPLPASLASSCAVGMTTNDAYLTVHGGSASVECQTIVDQSTNAEVTSSSIPGDDSQVCSVTDTQGDHVTVYDSGGQVIGTQACTSLRQGNVPSLQPM